MEVSKNEQTPVLCCVDDAGADGELSMTGTEIEGWGSSSPNLAAPGN
jgi:hypothetical protein